MTSITAVYSYSVIRQFTLLCEIFIVTIGYKVEAKKSVGATEAADPVSTKTSQSTLYRRNAGLPLLVWTKIVAGLQLFTSVASAYKVI